MIYRIIAVLFVVGILAAAVWLSNIEECPRMVLGYNCHGDKCDHSPEELARAKAVMAPRHRW